MEQKVLKIMNILKRFTVEELSNYMECDASEIVPYIKEFEKKEIVHKMTNNEYLYDKTSGKKLKKKLKEQKSKTISNIKLPENHFYNLDNFNEFPAEEVFLKKSDLDFYNKCDEKVKKLIIKNVVLFNQIGNLPQSEVKILLKQIAEQYPEYKMNAQWYKIKYKRYLEEGLPGLYHNQLCTIDHKAYDEFKNLYLSPNQYTQEQAYEILKMKGYDNDDMPTLPTFIHRLKQEYTQEAISKLRSVKTQDADTDDAKIHKVGRKKKPHNMLFEEAANEYWEMIISNNVTISRGKKFQIKRLKKDFKGYKLQDIIQDVIIKYKKRLAKEGVCLGTIKALIGLLLSILRMCGFHREYDIYENLTNSSPIYTMDEVKRVVLSNSSEAWVVALGLKLSELQAIMYEDINFEEGILTVQRRYMHGKLVQLKQEKFIKKLKVPHLLLEKIDPNAHGFIFGKIKMSTYESCLYAHIMLLQSQHVPMHLIAKQMGYESINTFYVQFRHLFPRKLDNDFNIFKPLGII